MRLLIACFLLTIMCFSSCHRKQPNGVLSEQEMEAVLEEFHLAKSLASQKDSSDFYRGYYFRSMASAKRNSILLGNGMRNTQKNFTRFIAESIQD